MTLSSSDSEGYVLCEGGTYILFMNSLLKVLKGNSADIPNLIKDNDTTVWLKNHEGRFARNKHIMIRDNYVKELIPYFELHLERVINTLLNLTKYDNLIRKIYTFIPEKINSLLPNDVTKNFDLKPYQKIPQKIKSTLYPKIGGFKYKYLKYKKKYLKLKELLDI